MVVHFDLVTKIDVFRTIGDVSIPNDEIFALLENSLSVKQIRSIINFGIQRFEKFYCCDIIDKIHQNIKWSHPNQDTKDGHGHVNKKTMNEKRNTYHAAGYEVIGIARNLIINNFSIGRDHDWAHSTMKAVFHIRGLMSKIYNFCDLWSLTQCKCVNRRWMYDVYNMKYISCVSINELIQLGWCDLSSILSYIASSSEICCDLLNQKDRLSLYEYQRYKRLILQCKYCDTISIDIDCNVDRLSNADLQESNNHWFGLIGNNFNQIDKIIFDSNCSLNDQYYDKLAFFTKYKNKKITKRIINGSGDTNKLSKNIYLQMMDVNISESDYFSYTTDIFLNFIDLIISQNKLCLNSIKFEIELYFDAQYRCRLKLLESQSSEPLYNHEHDHSAAVIDGKNTHQDDDSDDDGSIAQVADRIAYQEKMQQKDIIKCRMKSFTIEVINKMLQTKFEENNFKLESLKTVEICVKTPDNNGCLSDISGYECLNQIITMTNAPRFENLKLMIGNYKTTFPSQFEYVLTQILNNKTGYSDDKYNYGRSQQTTCTKIKTLEISVEKNLYRLEPLFSAIYGNHDSFCFDNLTQFEIVPFKSFRQEYRLNKYKNWTLPSISVSPIDYISTYVSSLKELYNLLTMIDKIRIGNNNININNSNLDNENDSCQRMSNVNMYSATMRGINIILKIDGARAIHQWQNVDLDLSKSQKLINVVQILYQWYKCGTMMNVGVGFQVPIGKDKNDIDAYVDKILYKLREMKAKAIKESKWIKLIIKAIIHVFKFRIQFETKDVINCLKKILIINTVNNDESEMATACFLNQTISISLSLKLDKSNAYMLLLVKINPRSSTRVFKP